MAANRALAIRCGLACAAVSAQHLRRFPGSLNNKKSLPEPFETRVFCPPTQGTISAVQLAELLAEDAAFSAAPVATPVAKTVPASVVEEVPELDGQMAAKVAKLVAPKKPSSRESVTGLDVSGSSADWHWVLQKMQEMKPLTDAELVLRLEKIAGARLRQGKRASHPDHARYAARTVEKARQKLDARRAARCNKAA